MSRWTTEPRELARRTVEACGLGVYAVIASADRAAALVAALRQLGATGMVLGAPRDSDQEKVDVVLWERLLSDSEQELPLELEALRVRVRRAVHLVQQADRDRSAQRDALEAAAFDAGMRKHSAYYRVALYEQLDQPAQALELLFEPLSDELRARYPIEQLQADRQLHMDMLREVGRRGDAHVVRYHKAAEHVRPGDAVLDLACGYGYGSHVLFQQSQAASVLGMDLDASAIEYARANYARGDRVRFEVGNAQQLSGLADDSIDFVATFETIEHLPEPALYLDELRRVLKPSGRVFVCAPNDWSDETGEDPNPHHLHVYTWERLKRELGARFLLERGYVQVAGGAMKCHHSRRSWAAVSLSPLQEEAEWILLLGMKTPLGASQVPYVETAWRVPRDDGDGEPFHVTAFARDYDNPWLVKAMVTRGMRAESAELLRGMQDAVLAEAPQGSVDRGAALCCRIHDRVAAGDLGAAGALDAEVEAYARITSPTPHQLRWQVSLLSAIAEMWLVAGDRERAGARFAAAAALDPSPYSPLLGNKTLDARFRLVQMAVVDGDLEAAREQLVRSVAEAQRLVSGSWRNVVGDPALPLPFGPAELAQLLDRAARAAYALRELDVADLRPGLFAREASGWYERVLGYGDAQVASVRQGIDGLRGELDAKEARVQELAAEVIAQDRRAQELAARVRTYQDAEKVWHERMLPLHRRVLGALGRLFGRGTSGRA